MTAVTKFNLNDIELEEICSLPPCNEHILEHSIPKNLLYHQVKDNLDSYTKNVLSIMMDNSDKTLKYNYVMIRYFDLIPNKPTGNALWHLDSNLLPTEKYENFLFCSECEILTEFVKDKIIVDSSINDKYEFNKFIDKNKKVITKIKPFTITKYNETHVHRGPIPTKFGKKLLIRLSNTNRKLPVYK